ncbi:thioredoxin family protein [Salipiger aestuarii]|uniref:Thioredoxin-like protein n=1 Tax=Salipiger aestuarii TaxID=568098 RepID=A0A327XMV0_9RHOB|nr:thioredoxin family protein [Salipiger aestuarii]EIE52337.1 thioredoxin SoxW [Citreicella sp. 357]KAA8606883.1 thioredoxin [Salipiger aestuarii]KAB2535263.1 thioredoxin [Salipiger aestuarii]RAK08555.1 thioredoxin-like protein [Salipiger aestuarii]
MKTWTGALALLVCSAWAAWGEVAPIGDDGLHKEPWLRDTFKDLREDLTEANAEGKRLVLMVEQRGCIYCTQMHEEVFSDPDIRDYIETHFFVVQINLHGDTEITDFDGDTLSEKQAARKWRVLFTPNILFLPEEVPEAVSAADAAVAVMPGAFGKGTTTDMFVWVAQKRYALDGGEDFQRYHARRIRERSDGATD